MFLIILLNHRILGTLGDHIVQPPCWSRVPTVRCNREAWSFSTTKMYCSHSSSCLWFCGWRGWRISPSWWKHVNFVFTTIQWRNNTVIWRWVSTKTHTKGSSTPTRHWRETRVSLDGRKHWLYALGVEKLPNRLERTVHTWIRKADNCLGGCSFTRSLDMTRFFWSSRYLKRY